VNGRELRTALFLASRDVLKSKRIVALVFLSLAFSFVNVIFLSSMMQGMTRTLTDVAVNAEGDMTIIPQEDQRYIEGVQNLRKKLNAVPGITGNAPRILEGVTIEYKGKSLGRSIMGISLRKEEGVSIIPHARVVDGEHLSENDRGEVVVPLFLADELEGIIGDNEYIRAGKTLKVTYGNGRIKHYRVKGIIDPRSFAFSNYLITTDTEVEEVTGVSDRASTVAIRVSHPEDLEKYRLQVERLNIGGDIQIWSERFQSIRDFSAAMILLGNLVSAVGILVAAVIIAIIIYINSEGKKRQIGILKAIGAKNNVILLMFFLEAIIFAIVGIFLGFVLVILSVDYLVRNPIRLPFGDLKPVLTPELVLSSVLAFFLMALLAGSYPAWRAARQNIIKAIWGE
jgi:putative ABC transport system permease protein